MGWPTLVRFPEVVHWDDFFVASSAELESFAPPLCAVVVCRSLNCLIGKIYGQLRPDCVRG